MNRLYRELEALLGQEAPEELLHSFLFRNAFLLCDLGSAIKRAFSKPCFGSDFKADFALVGWGNYAVWTFVEIERSSHRLFTKEGLPSQALARAINQINSWWIWMYDYGEYAGDHYSDLSGDRNACIVIGRRASLKPVDIRRLKHLNQTQLAGKLRVLTYDCFLDRLASLTESELEVCAEVSKRLTEYPSVRAFSLAQLAVQPRSVSSDAT